MYKILLLKLKITNQTLRNVKPQYKYKFHIHYVTEQDELWYK
jgi:hypothetical protein